MPLRQWQAPALEQLLFSKLPCEAQVLDLCCGSGHFSQRATWPRVRCHRPGFLAGNARDCEPAIARGSILLADAADCTLPEPVDAIVCLFDSLNHLLDPGDLAGFAPLFRWGSNPRTVSSLGAGTSDYGDLLCGGEDEPACLSAVRRFLQNEVDNWDVLDLQEVRGCSVLLQDAEIEEFSICPRSGKW